MKVGPLKPVALDMNWSGGAASFSLLEDGAATTVTLDLGNGG